LLKDEEKRASSVYIILILAILGSAVGSFLNVCISRIPEGASLIFPSSHCPKCKKKLLFFDLIPIISYFLLSGKCRYCGKKISVRYPVVEAITAFVFIMSYIKYRMSIDLLFFLVIASLLIIISFIDLEHMVIPDFLMIIGIFLGLIYSLYSGNMIDALKGISVGFVFMYLLGLSAKYLFKKEALGEGDIKLVVMLSSFLGVERTFISIFSGSIIGSVIAGMLMLAGRLKRQDYIPFGPFLSLGALIVMLL